MELQRQVIGPHANQPHCLPSNAILPPHHGLIITRGVQELACVLSQDLSFATATRLLGWHTQDAQLLSETTLRTLVRTHGQLIRQAEQTMVDQLLQEPDVTTLTPHMVPLDAPRRRAGWSMELTQAVEAAVAAGATRPPVGVSSADWERVLTARQADADRPVRDLRVLGPEVAVDQVLVTGDEVLTRTPQHRSFNELRTARIVTAAGTRYLSGTGDQFLTMLLAVVLLCAGPHRHILLLVDGARWLRNWFLALQALRPTSTLLLDWWHLRKKCADLSSMICHGRQAKAALLRPLLRTLWQGDVDGAIRLLEDYRPAARNGKQLDALIQYLEERRPYILNYRHRRRERQYIGSGHVEKANDLIVARRQKGAGMHWSLATSDALAALRTLMLNDGWDRYWQQQQVLPFAA